jgi:hypothetical protein
VRIDIRGETQHLEGPDDHEDYAEGEWVENAEGIMEFRAADGSIVSAAEWNEGVPAAEAAPEAAAEAAAEAAPEATEASEAVAAEAPADTEQEGGDEATS